MGVDVSIFVKNAKVRYCGDRDHVLQCWHDTHAKMDELMEKFRDPKQGLGMYEALILLANIRCWKETHWDEDEEEDRKEYVRYWLNQFERFVKLYPGDTFFALADNDDRYHDIYDQYERSQGHIS